MSSSKIFLFGNIARELLKQIKKSNKKEVRNNFDEMITNQETLMVTLFPEYYKRYSLLVDQSNIGKIFRNERPLPDNLRACYCSDENAQKLVKNIEKIIEFHLRDNTDEFIKIVHSYIMNDIFLPESEKQRLYGLFPDISASIQKKAVFIAEVIWSSADAFHNKGDAIFKVPFGKVPSVCAHFCGREKELAQIKDVFESKSKVFLQGFSGIGKSELAKKYAEISAEKYAHIIYFSYNGSLKSNITEMYFQEDRHVVDQMNKEKSQKRKKDKKDNEEYEVQLFEKHNSYLKALNRHYLLIIDNFNVAPDADPFFQTVMQYNCNVLFTTTYQHENVTTIEVKEFEDPEDLLSLVKCIYPFSSTEKETIKEIIAVLQYHTYGVTLSAKLMAVGLFTSEEILAALKENTLLPDISDTFVSGKDVPSAENGYKEFTFRQHFQKLFALIQLSEEEKCILRNMYIIPHSGINGREFARLLECENMNSINHLIKVGLIQKDEDWGISVHSLVRDCIKLDLDPKLTDCLPLLSNLYNCYCNRVNYVPKPEVVLRTDDDFITIAQKQKCSETEKAYYIKILADEYKDMISYNYTRDMQLILEEAINQIELSDVENAQLKALYYAYFAKYHTDLNRRREACEVALHFLSQFNETIKNRFLKYSILVNLAFVYFDSPKITQWSKAKQLFEESRMIWNSLHNEMGNVGKLPILSAYDILQKCTYAIICAALGEPKRAIDGLMTFAADIKDKTQPYHADIYQALSVIYACTGEESLAQKYREHAKSLFGNAYGSYSEICVYKEREYKNLYLVLGEMMWDYKRSMMNEKSTMV